MNLPAFHSWLRTALPNDAAGLLRELEVSHRAMPEAFKDFPRDGKQLSEALLALAVKRLLRREGTEWRWCAEAKEEPKQGALFG